MVKQRKMSAKEVAQEKADRVMNGVASWVSFYRENPHRFAKDFLNVNLKLFQKILLYAMMHNYYFMYLAARGQGKSWIIALYCIIRCILYPGTKIVVTAGVKSQATEVLSKIKDDFCKTNGWGSANLRNEIHKITISQNIAEIEFKNGSWIKVKTSNDNARSARANVLITDEFRMVDLNVINTVLRRFLTAPRQPGYLSKPEYAHLQERNVEIYASSCWYSSHWMMDKIKAYFINMMTGTKKYFVCSLPYQVSILENLLSREQIEDEMSEADFDEITFLMEMEALMFGDTDGNFFTYDDISKRRKLKNAFYPLELYQKKDIPIPKLAAGEERILSVDIALMSSKKNNNDASSLMINSAIPISDTEYTSNMVYMQNYEGLTTDELGIIVMRTFYKYNCTQLVMDCQGVGMGCYDFVIKDQVDPQTGETYKALTCCNNDEMASRCKIKDAKKVIWSVKAGKNFNTEMCILLRTGFQNGKINLLVHEFEGQEYIKSKVKGFNKLSPTEQAMLKIPYIQTSLMINELINLDHEINGDQIKIKEKSGMRKDRYSSLGYNYWCLNQIMRKKKPRKNNTKSIADILASHTKKARKVGAFN